jgi:ABC-type transport system involved in multi-copper enzyme maturation permease subunit
MTTTTTTTTTPVVPYSSATASGTVLTQTWGLLVDSYRELHHKKLFWITLVLSLLVVVAFAFVGINEVGVTIFTWEIPGVWNTNFIPRDSFYKFLFVSLAIPFWLGIAASALALISVAGIFPDMLTGGSIDLYLAKPISRLRLFLTKYFCGLLFVALQVLVFCTASFFVMGIRGGTWEPGVFLAVPIVTLFFSYLFCICVLLGVVTRSTLVAILLTVLAWFGLWMFNTADGALLAFKAAAQQEVAAKQKLVDFNENVIRTSTGNTSQFEFQRDRQKERLAEAQDIAGKLTFWHTLILRIKTPLPKTSETMDLLNRWLVKPDPFFAVENEQHSRREQRRTQRRAATTTTTTTAASTSAPVPPQPPERDSIEMYVDRPETQRQIHQEITGRSIAWVVGTSLGFEAFVLAIAAWVFCRRDY